MLGIISLVTSCSVLVINVMFPISPNAVTVCAKPTNDDVTFSRESHEKPGVYNQGTIFDWIQISEHGRMIVKGGRGRREITE